MWLDTALYILCILSIFLALGAQIKVKTTFNKFSRTQTGRGRTAAEVARMILDQNGLTNVRVERVGGSLTDHYDPRANVLRLSDSTYDNASAAAIGVAAHEAGHAIQHARRYMPIVIRSRLVPVTSFASRFSWIVIFLGVLYSATDAILGQNILLLGIGLFAVTTLFQLVTLPCEFDASRRAMASLRGSGWYTESELSAASKTLRAAALTYVAAFLTSILQLLRLIVRFTGNRRR
ncbi:MAG: zinc metallopeptidase [Clostridia bacterium]|nr:zinc metallopeptidase [Clostridia bacterium]